MRQLYWSCPTKAQRAAAGLRLEQSQSRASQSWSACIMHDALHAVTAVRTLRHAYAWGHLVLMYTVRVHDTQRDGHGTP